MLVLILAAVFVTATRSATVHPEGLLVWLGNANGSFQQNKRTLFTERGDRISHSPSWRVALGIAQ